MKKQLPVLIYLCVVCVVVQSCYFNVDTYGSWKNKYIDESLRTEIAGLNEKLYQYIKTDNINGIKSLMSQPLLSKSGKKIDTVINTFGEILKKSDYRLLDEYYQKNLKDSSNNTLSSDKSNYNDYKIQYVSVNKKSYVSVMVSTNLSVNYMVMAIYGKYDEVWKLNALRIGEYSILDQTAPEYYQSSNYQYNKSNLLDAADLILVASEVSRPAGDLFQYNNDDDMKALYSTILKEFNSQYHLPFAINRLKTKPEIFSISPQLITDIEPKGIIPMIKYKSAILISDTVALKAENQDIQKIIGELFPGIDKRKPGIIYRVYNDMPDGKKMIAHYSFLQRLKYGK